MTPKKEPTPEEPYKRDDFLRDLKKASRKLEPGERQPKKKPSERSEGKS